ncbi:MAG: DUF4145 domain-containing protein [Eubacteriales bacterium]|nr:DUF4145 domain-containing protein [Eubacteriales bacterium]
MTDNRIAEIKQRAENGLMDVASQISRGDYSLGLIKARQVMEQVVRGYAKNYKLEYTDLAGTIETLYKANAISNEDRESLHTIRQLGNMAVQESYNDAQDAEKSYYLLKHEIELYLTFLLSLLNADRPISDEFLPTEAVKEPKAEEAVKNTQEAVKESPLRKREQQQGIDIPDLGQRERKSSANRNSKPAHTANGAPRNSRNDRGERNKTVRNDQRGGQHRGSRNSGSGVNVTDLLKILVPIFCIILLIILINSIIPKKPKETETQTTPVVTTEATLPETSEPETETTEPETETEAKLRYKVSADTVNARYADNQDRIYEQLSKGTEIGEVEEIEGSDFVKFERDGITLVVNKNYIEPIEE